MPYGPKPQKARCHPERRHYGRGLCNPCWQKLWKAENREKVIASQQKYRKDNPEKVRASERRRGLRRYYGITVETYDALYNAQDGRCAICGGQNVGGRKLAVDHNHETGEVRGLLCNLCNRGIGALRDDPELISRAASYLRGLPDELKWPK